MADITIGELPQASAFDDDSLLVTENQGQAQKVPGKMIKTYATDSINAALQNAKDSGEFDGDPGYTPQRGTDYWTAADQAAIVQDVLNELPELPEGGGVEVVQTTGDSETAVMSQKAVTDALVSAKNSIVTPEKTTFIKVKENVGGVLVPQFTNLADPTSNDWMNNKMTNPSNGDIADWEGAFVSNAFNVKAGDVIRIKGVAERGEAFFKFQPYTDSSGSTRITSGFYFTKNASQTANGVVNATTVKDGVTEWTLGTYDNGTQHPYVSQFVTGRVSGVPITSVNDIIITINEEVVFKTEGETVETYTLDESINVPMAIENKDQIEKLRSGARWFAFGDSITAGWTSVIDTTVDVGYRQFKNTNEAERWVNIVAAKNGYELTNYGVGAIGYACGSANARVQVNEIDFSQCDFVTLAFGVNDWKGKAPLGSMEDDVDTVNAFVPNMRYVIKKILADNPYCKIFVITPINCRSLGRYDTNWGINYANADNASGPGLEQIFQLQKTVCEYHGIELIDMTHSSVVNRENIATMLPDYTHPTVEGHAAIARELSQKINFK